jgi:hypothetical protein
VKQFITSFFRASDVAVCVVVPVYSQLHRISVRAWLGLFIAKIDALMFHVERFRSPDLLLLDRMQLHGEQVCSTWNTDNILYV